MPEILNITKKGRSYYLALDDGDKIMLLSSVAQKYSLRRNSQIPDNQLKKIIIESDLQRGRDYVTYLLSRRAYSYGQLLVKLDEKKFDRKISIKILSDLKEAGLVDDNRFARQMVESMLRNKPAGRAFLVAALRKKYISRELAEVTVDDYLEDVDEIDIAVKLLRSRWRYFSKFELETARRKAYNYLSRRSIGYRSAKAAFEKVAEEEN
jgi:regulatory protein